jgi:hypothetical protein
LADNATLNKCFDSKALIISLNKKGVNHHQDARESDFDKPVVSGIS